MPERDSQSPANKLRVVALLVVAVLLVAVGAYALFFRATYGTWNIAARPERVDFNGARFFPYGMAEPLMKTPGPVNVVQDNLWPLPDILIDSTQDSSYLFYLYVRTWDGKLWRLGAGGRA